jgi:hypothetical protein
VPKRKPYKRRSSRDRRQSVMNGKWTYFIQAGEGGPVKIGSATNVAARLKHLQVSNSSKLRILAKTKLVSEADAHALFADAHIRGEWFEPSEFIMNFATKMC